MSEPQRPPLGPATEATSHLVQFAEFELDLTSFELHRSGEPVDLQPQPSRLLALLVSRPGETVSREEIRAQIWGAETHVDHEQAINFAIRKIRMALGDQAAAPRFVETLPRAGYRFRSPVSPVPQDSERGTGGEPLATVRAAETTEPTTGVTVRRRRSLIAAAALLGLAAALVWLWPRSRLAETAAHSETAGPASPLSEELSPQIYDQFLQGRYMVENPDLGKVQTGVEKLLEVIDNAPRLAPAHLALGEGYLHLGGNQKFEAFMPLAESAARRALELDPDLADAHLLLSKVLFFHQHDWDAAEAAVVEAQRLAPEDADVLEVHGIMLASRGQHAEAMALVRRAIEIDPGSVLVASDLAFCLLYAGDLDGALAATSGVLELAPNHLYSRFLRASIWALQGDPRAGPEMARTVAATSAQSLEEALDWHIAAVELRLQAGLSGHFDLALLHAVGNRPEKAFEHLQQACDQDPSWELPYVVVDPRFESVRQLPGFMALADCFPPQSVPTS